MYIGAAPTPAEERDMVTPIATIYRYLKILYLYMKLTLQLLNGETAKGTPLYFVTLNLICGNKCAALKKIVLVLSRSSYCIYNISYRYVAQRMNCTIKILLAPRSNWILEISCKMEYNFRRQ